MKSFLNRDLRNRNSFRGGNKNKPKICTYSQSRCIIFAARMNQKLSDVI